MDGWTILGLAAGFLTTVGFVPQIIKGYRTKHMGDVSMTMPLLLGLGMLLWLAYGVTLGNLPIVLWNAIGFTLNMVLLFLKRRYRDRACPSAPA